MLRIVLGEVRAGAVETPGRIEPADALWAGSAVAVTAPVDVRGRFSFAGEHKYFWHATLSTLFRLECRRCLSPVEVPFRHELELIFVGEEDALDDDVGCYVIPRRALELDLRETVREELLLAVPQFVECREGCRGLCPRCGANLNAGPCGCRAESDPRWASLASLLPDRQTED